MGVIRASKWKNLAVEALGLNAVDVDRIESNYEDNVDEQVFKALLLWHMRKRKYARWKELANSCRQIDPTLPQKILDVCKLEEIYDVCVKNHACTCLTHIYNCMLA